MDGNCLSFALADCKSSLQNSSHNHYILNFSKIDQTQKRSATATFYRGTIMIDKELLSILCCPETKQDLELADQQLIDKTNQLIKKGVLKNRAGEQIREPIDAGLIREDRKYLYPVREDIPILLIDESILIEDIESKS